MRKNMKSLMVLALAVTSFGTLSGVAAATLDIRWWCLDTGLLTVVLFSNYYHGSKYHEF